MNAKLGKRYIGTLTKMSKWEYSYSQGGFPTSGRMEINYDKMSKWVASKKEENQLTGMAIACMLIYGEINELVKNMIVRKYGQALVDEIMLIKKDESIEISRTFQW